jgi:hypothetical protein
VHIQLAEHISDIPVPQMQYHLRVLLKMHCALGTGDEENAGGWRTGEKKMPEVGEEGKKEMLHV